MPLRELLEGLGEVGDDEAGLAVAETRNELLGVIGAVPESNDDAVFGEFRAEAGILDWSNNCLRTRASTSFSSPI